MPTASMPGAGRAFAGVNPVSLTVNAARGLMIGHVAVLGPAPGSLACLACLACLAGLAGLLAVFVPLATRTLQRG